MGHLWEGPRSLKQRVNKHETVMITNSQDNGPLVGGTQILETEVNKHETVMITNSQENGPLVGGSRSLKQKSTSMRQ